MSGARQLRLGAFMRPAAIHPAAWRYPGAIRDMNMNFPALRRAAQKLEQGCFDCFFQADQVGVPNARLDLQMYNDNATALEPFTLLGALAVSTDRIGLVATVSTSFEEPYNLARRMASLDHISEGRAGWNIVTTWVPEQALNFNHDSQPEHGDRYARAREFYDVVTGLWDSFEEDAFSMDQASGVYFDPAKAHVLNHKGRFFKVRGPLNIQRPPQGWPVIVQAGASDAGMALAAETAEVIFGAAPTLEAAKQFYSQIKAQMVQFGRDPDHMKILPAAFVVVGDTDEEARSKAAYLDSLVRYEVGLSALSQALGVDASKFDPDGPLPEIPETNSIKSARANVLMIARDKGFTVRQMAAQMASGRRLALVGSPETIADQMEQWLYEGGCDGFNLMFSWMPAGLEDFVDKVIPVLQARGLFRKKYEGRTLRDHLGLPRPISRHAPQDGSARPHAAQ